MHTLEVGVESSLQIFGEIVWDLNVVGSSEGKSAFLGRHVGWHSRSQGGHEQAGKNGAELHLVVLCKQKYDWIFNETELWKGVTCLLLM